MTIKMSQYLKQEENVLIAVKPCTLTLDMATYSEPGKLIIEDDIIRVKSLISKIEFEDKVFNIVLDYAVDIDKTNIIEKNKQVLILDFKENSNIVYTSSEASEIGGQIQFVERLIGGREMLKDVAHLYKRLLSVYSPPTSNMDSVHLELLCSQVLRNKNDVQKLARLTEPYEPNLVNIKKVVFASGFLQGLSFENVSEAIRSGLIAEEEIDPSIIEKILTGTVVKKKNTQ